LAFTCFDATTKLEVMILFSCWEQSEIKNSFMSLREIALPCGCRRRPEPENAAREHSQD
jgi:hypothetical protein